MPTEIHRAVRGLDTLAFWKGLEFRTFLLYIGPVVLKDFLPEDAYKHFLYLFCAIRICSSERFFKTESYARVAKSILNDYIEQYINIYGIDSIGSNVHNLSHLIEDVKRFGILPKISAYPFENMLYFIKNLLRSGKHPLAQAANRISEMTECKGNDYLKNSSPKNFPYLSKLIKGEMNKYAQVNFGGFILANNEKNKWFLTKSNEIVQMDYATTYENNIYMFGGKIKYLYPFFRNPFNSTFIKVFSSDGILHETKKLYSTDDIDCKLIALKYREEKVFIPLLHTLD